MRRRPMPRPKFTHLTPMLALLLLIVAVPLALAADDTPPNISYSVDGILGANTWYRGSIHGNYIVVHWTVSDPESPITSAPCEQYIPVAGPNKGTTLRCSATSDGGTTTIDTKVLKIDADPPTGVTAVFSRKPDFNGWYNHPVGIGWQGADATSGIAACGTGTFAGPDRAGATVTGSCTDMAGNTASASALIDYDATAPLLKKVHVDSNPGSDVIHWVSTSTSDTAVVQRWARGNEKQQAVLFRGSGTAFADGKVAPGLEYNYAVQTVDQAGNASKRIVVVGLPKVLLLGKTGYVPRAAAKPILRWNRVAGAKYYNVQLYRGSKRIFAAWPAKNQLGLPAGWRWNGKRQRLSAGKYRWYVWAGFGARSFAHYQAVGSAQFIVPPR
jgi:hypothetical protein